MEQVKVVVTDSYRVASKTYQDILKRESLRVEKSDFVGIFSLPNIRILATQQKITED